MKCIDDEIPFEIPRGWEWCRLGAIGSWGSGATPSKGHPEFYGGSIPWLTTGELNESYVFDTKVKVTEKALACCSLRKCATGDVLIAMYGATIGKVAIAGCELTTNQACCACTPYYNYNKYLFYFLMSNKLNFIKMGEGGAQPNISKEKIVATLCPLPPLNEQRRIVNVVESLIPKIEHFTTLQANLEELNASIFTKLRKSILQEAIQGRFVPQDPADEPASVLLERIREEKQRLLKEGKLKKKDITDSVIFKGDDNKYYERINGNLLDISDEVPFDLPDTWAWCRFLTIVNYRIGKTPARGETAYWHPASIPWVSISDMKEYGLVQNTKERISNEASKVFGDIVPKGTLLMSFKLTVGRTAFLDINAFHNEAIISIFPYVAKEVMKRYLFYTLPLLANMGNSKDAIKGKTLNTNSINNLLIPVPPVATQEAIINKIQEAFSNL